MKPEAQRIAIATIMKWEHCGCGNEECTRWRYKNGIGDPLLDLNAIHEAEQILPNDNSLHGLVVYCNVLMKVCGSHQACHFATAAQRAEAFLKTIGKWVE